VYERENPYKYIILKSNNIYLVKNIKNKYYIIC
jgi:hypothetical protein